MASGGRVQAFVSSTIRDFHDLRSAIKTWLEELGFQVMLSEYNDFERRPDSATFDACFEAVAKCDYFILLIGTRIGSMLEDGLSVTRHEFRVASELAAASRIKILPFIRADVIDALKIEDNQEASQFLTGVTGSDPPISSQQLATIREFVEEIRATEIPSSGAGGSIWIYRFGGFEGIAEAMRVAMRATRTVRRGLLLANLRTEIEENLSEVVEKRLGIPWPIHWFLGTTRNDVDPRSTQFESDIALNRGDARNLVEFAVGMSSVSNLRLTSAQEAILSGELLKFDPPTRDWIEPAEHTALRQLAQEIERCQTAVNATREPPMSAWYAEILAQFIGEVWRSFKRRRFSWRCSFPCTIVSKMSCVYR